MSGSWQQESSTARICDDLELYGDTRPPRDNWVEPFAEPPAEDLHSWPSSFFTDSGDDPELQMPMRTVSTWDPVRRGRHSWQA